MARACMAANGTRSLVLIDDVGRRSRMKSETCRAVLTAQPNAEEPKHTTKATQDFLKANEKDIHQ